MASDVILIVGINVHAKLGLRNMKQSVLHILFVMLLALQPACESTISRTVASREAMQSPLVCALYAAQVTNDSAAMREVARRYAEAGAFAQALAIVEAIPERNLLTYRYRKFYFREVIHWNASAKLEALADIAVLQAKAGKKAEAAATLERAFAVAYLLPFADTPTLPAYLERILPHFVLIGQEERAFTLLNQLQAQHGESFSPNYSLSLLTAIARSLTTIGNQSRSLQTLADAEKLFAQAVTLEPFGEEGACIAEEYARLGFPDKARQVLMQAITREREYAEKNPMPKPAGMKNCAVQLAKLGQVQQGIALADTIPDAETKALALVGIAELIAQTKNYPVALALLEKIPPGELRHRYQAQVRLAKQMLDDGVPDQALAIMRQMPHGDDQADILAEAANYYRQRGDFAQAYPLAQTAFEAVKQRLNSDSFPESVTQYALLVDKPTVLEILREEGKKADSGWLLSSVAEEMVRQNQEKLAIEVLKYIQMEGQIIHGGTISIRDYRAGAIGKIALHYYDSKRPLDTQLQTTLGEFVKLLD